MSELPEQNPASRSELAADVAGDAPVEALSLVSAAAAVGKNKLMVQYCVCVCTVEKKRMKQSHKKTTIQIICICGWNVTHTYISATIG